MGRLSRLAVSCDYPVNSDLTLHDPAWLLALLAVVAVVWLRRLRAAMVFLVPFAAEWSPRSMLHRVWWWPWVVALTGLMLLTIAMARPQQLMRKVLPPTEGCDIMLAIDLSGSMASEDFSNHGRPINRLDAVRPIIDAFIDQRSSDRIGVVVFAGRAYTLSPPTLNHGWLKKQVDRLRPGMMEDGTAIGDALGVALRRLELAPPPPNGPRTGAFIVLLTDGANNSGSLEPLEAAAIARSRDIPVYTIATGSHGVVRIPIRNSKGETEIQFMSSEIDEAMLWHIAHTTLGRFFRAEWPETLAVAFDEIDRGQKVHHEPKTIVLPRELFGWFALPGMLLLGLAAAAVRSPWHRWVSA
jgi:Ca-activated chloride channel homolog